MTTKYLRQLYFKFFAEKEHTLIPSASLVPENDPTVLFTTAGMHPLVPYLMGEKHPAGVRLVDAQKCLRTGDIEDVGDPSHLTFFEMLGNWSLGDYFKDESIRWSYEFLTDSRYLNFEPEKIHVTVFEGDAEVPKDKDSAAIWEKLGIPSERIHFMPRKDNFWGPVGETGPCGPDTEIFFDTDKVACGPECKPGCSCGKYFEIWNNVFMEYEKKADGTYVPLAQKNVDTGMGLERTVAMMNGYESVYEIDTIEPLMKLIRAQSENLNDKSQRIIADHMRAITFLLSDERVVRPSNVDQGYVLRRLIRRTIRHAKMIEMPLDALDELVRIITREHHRDYPELLREQETVLSELHKERDKFLQTLEQGIKMFDKFSKDGNLSGSDAATLYTSYGFPIEMIDELAVEKNITVDHHGFEAEMRAHADKSRTASAGKFKGGLADHDPQTIKYHTANHIMLEAMKRVLGREEVHQKGSNITKERLRFDFTFPRKLTDDEIAEIEKIANEAITQNLPVHFEEMSVDKAKELGATGVFDHKYGDSVKVYFVGDFSKEICGGPHVENTKGMGHLKIKKEQASSAGVRRVKAVLE